MGKPGRPKGSKDPHTIEREKAKELMNQRILKRLNPLLNSQFVLAQGVTHVYKIVTETDSKGKTTKRETVLVTDPEEIKDFLDEHEGTNGVMGEGEDSEYYFISTKAPDNKAIDSMLDRVFGKSTQTIDDPGSNDGLKKINTTLADMFHAVKSKRATKENTPR